MTADRMSQTIIAQKMLVQLPFFTEAMAAIGPAKIDATPAPVKTTPKFVVAHFGPKRSAVIEGKSEKISPHAKKHSPERAMNQTGWLANCKSNNTASDSSINAANIVFSRPR